MLRILIADRHEIVRKRVRRLIEARSGWEVCAETADGQEALQLALQQQPDIAILDVALPRLNGLEVTRLLTQGRSSTRVLLFTSQDDDLSISGALAAGALGYVLKTDSEEDLQAAVTALASNHPYFSALVSELLLSGALNGHAPSRLQSLTARELQVARLIAAGKPNRQIADLLGISIKTVESHRSAALRKSGVRTAAEFVRFAIKHKLIEA